MAKKKAPVQKNVVSPNPKNVKVGVDFDTLDEGDVFIMDGELWQRLEEGYLDQAASNLITGELRDNLCGDDTKVIPVTITIAWEVK